MESEQQYSKEYEEQELQQPFVVPNSKNKLRACLRCHLIKTQQQWKSDHRCENCGPFKDSNQKNKTTQKFDHVVSLIEPTESWLKKRIKLPRIKLVSGAYAVKVHQ